MADKRTKSSSVYIVFHIGQEMGSKHAIYSVDRTMKRTFDTTATRLHFEDSREIIYAIQKPALDSPQFMQEFFENLAKVFRFHSELSPHFTQMPDQGGSRA